MNIQIITMKKTLILVSLIALCCCSEFCKQTAYSYTIANTDVTCGCNITQSVGYHHDNHILIKDATQLINYIKISDVRVGMQVQAYGDIFTEVTYVAYGTVSIPHVIIPNDLGVNPDNVIPFTIGDYIYYDSINNITGADALYYSASCFDYAIPSCYNISIYHGDILDQVSAYDLTYCLKYYSQLLNDNYNVYDIWSIYNMDCDSFLDATYQLTYSFDACDSIVISTADHFITVNGYIFMA